MRYDLTNEAKRSNHSQRLPGSLQGPCTIILISREVATKMCQQGSYSKLRNILIARYKSWLITNLKSVFELPKVTSCNCRPKLERNAFEDSYHSTPTALLNKGIYVCVFCGYLNPLEREYCNNCNEYKPITKKSKL